MKLERVATHTFRGWGFSTTTNLNMIGMVFQRYRIISDIAIDPEFFYNEYMSAKDESGERIVYEIATLANCCDYLALNYKHIKAKINITEKFYRVSFYCYDSFRG